MSGELHAAAAFAGTAALVTVLVPLAIASAGRLDFYDRPVGYKSHAQPTPFLGGAAVILAVGLFGIVLGGDLARLGALGVCAVLLCGVGTLDDRVELSPWPRLLAAFVAAVGIWIAGLGWTVGLGPIGDLAISALWVMALVNAFNLMDNMDGAAGSVGAASAAGIAALAVKADDVALAVLGLSLCGGCLAFLRFNLSRPARIFLGDGGSMPLGLLTATGIMALPISSRLGWPALLVGGLVVAVPAIDTLLVIWSRARRSVPIMTGGCDHLTHRLRARLSSPHAVALVLAAVQIVLGGIAVMAYDMSRGVLVVSLPIAVVLACAAVALLDMPGWAPSSSVKEADNRGDPATPTPVGL